MEFVLHIKMQFSDVTMSSLHYVISYMISYLRWALPWSGQIEKNYSMLVK